jgi:hypothetical protein
MSDTVRKHVYKGLQGLMTPTMFLNERADVMYDMFTVVCCDTIWISSDTVLRRICDKTKC